MAALSRPRTFSKHSARYKRTLWFERLMALIALANLVLVVLDLSYIPFRDFYLKVVPRLTVWYGETFKGIEPHRFTTYYLETVSALEDQVAQAGLASPQTQEILTDLQQQSTAMIDENPFQIANKSGTLELIKNKMRDRVGTESSKNAFNQFWSQAHLSQAGYAGEIRFFNAEIRPLMEANYFRGIAVDGGPIDRFWRIDIWFIGLFLIELLARSFYLSRRYKNLTWRDALLWRWYDLLLIIPFSALRLPWLALLRVIPVALRLSQARLVNLRPLQSRVSHFLISQVAIELTEVILLRIIDQVQNLIRNGEARRWLLNDGGGRQYIDINNINELEVITQGALTMLINQVLPQIKPELDAVVNQSVSNTMTLAPGYQSFRQLPGIGGVPNQISQQIIAQLSQSLYTVLQRSLESSRNNPQMEALMTKFTDTLRSELRQGTTLDDLETMLIALLEEVKLNYVKRLSEEDYEILQEQRYRLYNTTQESSQPW
ncbi:MAG: hypothetical protein ACFCVD_01360 [Nodosilinea sp.]